jgi:hypothetical protein
LPQSCTNTRNSSLQALEKVTKYWLVSEMLISASL